nr:hypothetical protein [Streptomyces armeniacus]
MHPRVDEAETRAVDWIDRSGFCRTAAERAWVLGSRSADFYARFVPEADPDRLWITACWVYWGFAFDDARCDEGELAADPAAFAAMAGRVQRALELPGAYEGDDALAAAVHDLGERFRACATPTQVRRFEAAHRAWLSGVQWQVGNRARGLMPGLDDYCVMRLHAAGGEPTFAMLEIANAAEVPAAEMDSPAVVALTEMAILVASLDNDFHSLAKEASREQTDQNLVNVLAHERDVPYEQALDDAFALRDRMLCRFLTLRERVLRRASRELARYLTDLGHGIRGNAEWGLIVPRYLSLNSGAEGPGETAAPDRIVWADRPRDSRAEPLPLPSLAWWWDDLVP